MQSFKYNKNNCAAGNEDFMGIILVQQVKSLNDLIRYVVHFFNLNHHLIPTILNSNHVQLNVQYMNLNFVFIAKITEEK